MLGLHTSPGHQIMLAAGYVQAFWADSAARGIDALGHRDEVTESKERAAAELGSMPEQGKDAICSRQVAGEGQRNGDCQVKAPSPQSCQAAVDRHVQEADGSLQEGEGRRADIQQHSAAAPLHNGPTAEHCDHALIAVQKLVTGLQRQDAIAALRTLAMILEVHSSSLGAYPLPCCILPAVVLIL